MESDVGAFGQDFEQEADSFLEAIGVAPLPTNSAAAGAADAEGPAPSLPAGVTPQAKAAEGVDRRWLGTDVSAASTLVVLVTVLCR